MPVTWLVAVAYNAIAMGFGSAAVIRVDVSGRGHRSSVGARAGQVAGRVSGGDPVLMEGTR